MWKISSVACLFSSIKIHYSDYLKSLISGMNDVYVFLKKKKKKLHLSHLLCCNHTCYCINMVSVMSGSGYIASVSYYHPRYQSRSA